MKKKFYIVCDTSFPYYMCSNRCSSLKEAKRLLKFLQIQTYRKQEIFKVEVTKK